MNDIFAHPTIQSLAAYIGQQTLDKSNFIEFAEHKRYHKITSSQYNIWLACQQKNLSLAHNMFAAFECSGKLDLKKIEDAINCQINENEILRTNFIMLDDIVYQQIKPFEEIN
jgi:hypothetical protein